MKQLEYNGTVCFISLKLFRFEGRHDLYGITPFLRRIDRFLQNISFVRNSPIPPCVCVCVLCVCVCKRSVTLVE